jgi:broad-specificity NMP kinase
MIYLLYGQPGSGKTTLGKLLANHLNTPFIIDGDEFREMFTNKNYGREGREENIRNANAVATYLNKKSGQEEWVAIYCKSDGGNSIQGRPVKKGTDVVMCLVNPYEKFRNELKEDNSGQVMEIMLSSTRDLRKEYHVEDLERGEPDCVINTDQDTEDSWGYLKTLLDI